MNYGYVAYGVCDFRCDAKKTQKKVEDEEEEEEEARSFTGRRFNAR